ncbi:hypothetical protein INT46_008087 [Mucor plumbeus]|uniref:3'-5' exonuclease domain-containing protein n=1 Tax=Mucor plumbeus TaxID=97098 RepID=A0A8H7V7G1_9FUNG|nr:hypothetical protein INT46_008087 [Mucor plumbeus]
MLRPFVQNSVGPARLSKILREFHMLRYDKLKLQYLDAATYRTKSPTLKMNTTHWKFPKSSEYKNNSKYASSLPFATYLKYMYTFTMKFYKPLIDAEMVKLGGIIFKGDHSFKIIKKLGKINGSSVFTALYTVCNEYEEVVLMLLVHTKSLTHSEETFTKSFQNYSLQGQEPPLIFFTDNVLGHQKFLEDCLPSLKTNVEHIVIPKATEENNVSVSNLPADVAVHEYTTAKQINDMATKIMNDLGDAFVEGSSDDSKAVYLGFDLEWVVYQKKERFYRRTSLIQIAYILDVFLLRLCMLPKKTDRGNHQLPTKLEQLLKCPQIFKIGKNVASDLRKLTKDYGIVTNGAFELSKFCVDKGAIKSTGLSLLSI